MCEIYNDGECSAIWREEHRQARRYYACDCCRRDIAKGEKYLNIASLYDGAWSVYRDCLRCEAAGDEFQKIHKQGFRGADLAEYLLSCLGDEPESREWIGRFFIIEETPTPKYRRQFDIRFDLPAPQPVCT